MSDLSSIYTQRVFHMGKHVYMWPDVIQGRCPDVSALWDVGMTASGVPYRRLECLLLPASGKGGGGGGGGEGCPGVVA